jgi:hypothetical protein
MQISEKKFTYYHNLHKKIRQLSLQLKTVAKTIERFITL